MQTAGARRAETGIEYNARSVIATETTVPTLTSAQRRLYDAALRLFAERGVTQVNVSELAQAAGVARGTVYNNLSDVDGLFTDVAARLSSEMTARIACLVRDIEDPADRLAKGIRFYVRRAHDDPHWGRFICRFGLNEALLQDIWTGQPAKDLLDGLEQGRFDFQKEQTVSIMALLASTVNAAIFLVQEGHKTWREAGSDAAECFLRAIGVARNEARSIADQELPDLPPAPR